MNCPKCGLDNGKRSLTCMSCGAALGALATRPESVEAIELQEGDPEPVHPLQRKGLSQDDVWKAVAFVICFVLFVCWQSYKQDQARRSDTYEVGGVVYPKNANWQQVATFTGDGIQTTARFTVGEEWRVEWTLEPGKYDNGISIYINDSSGSPIGVVSGGNGGYNAGTSAVHQAGTFYLYIIASQPYSITVRENKR